MIKFILIFLSFISFLKADLHFSYTNVYNNPVNFCINDFSSIDSSNIIFPHGSSAQWNRIISVTTGCKPVSSVYDFIYDDSLNKIDVTSDFLSIKEGNTINQSKFTHFKTYWKEIEVKTVSPEPEPETPTYQDISTSNPDGIYNQSSDGKTTTWFDANSNYYSYNTETGVLLVYNSKTNISSAYDVGGGFVAGNTFNTSSLLKEFTKDKNINDSSVSTACSSITELQEKMLCEINQGIKKLNQESNSAYSLNNLILALNKSSNINANDLNTGIKSIENLTNTLNTVNASTNSNLNNMNNQISNSNNTLDSINTTLNDIKNNTSGPDYSITNPDSSSPNLDNYLKPDTTSNTNDLDSNTQDTDSLIDSLINTFTTFKTNITDSFTTINTQITDTQSLIINPTNIFKNIEVVNCPTTYEANFSSFGLGLQTVIVDYCHYMSYLKPIIYFFTYLILMIGLITFSIRFIGVLL